MKTSSAAILHGKNGQKPWLVSIDYAMPKPNKSFIPSLTRFWKSKLDYTKDRQSILLVDHLSNPIVAG